MFFLLYVLD